MIIYIAVNEYEYDLDVTPCISPEVAELVRQKIARDCWNCDKPYESFADPEQAADYYFEMCGEGEVFAVRKCPLVDEETVAQWPRSITKTEEVA